MSSYSKMVVLPQEEYLQLVGTQQVQQPMTQKFHDLKQKDEDIEKVADPYRRLQLHGENLEEMKAVKEKIRRFITLSTPRQYRSRAESLLDIMDPHIKYSEKGEIIDEVTGQPIVGSHIDDLLQHAVRDMRRKVGEPTGWQYFLDLMMRENVPRHIVGTPTYLEMTKQTGRGPRLQTSRLPTPKRKVKGLRLKPEVPSELVGEERLRQERKPVGYYKF